MRLAVLGRLPEALAPAAALLEEQGVEAAEPADADLVLAAGPADAVWLAPFAATTPVAHVREDLAVRAALAAGDGLDAARAIDALPISSLVTAQWLAELLPESVHVRPPLAEREEPREREDGPLRIHAVAGWPQELAGTLGEAHEFVEDPGGADVVLTLTRAEHLPGPTLAAMAQGAAAVATLPPGREEVVVHGENGLVVAWDDPRGTARALDLLARDRALLARLQEGAARAAAAWPSPEEAAPALAAALEDLAAREPAGEEAAVRLRALAALPLREPERPAAPETRRGRPRLRRLQTLVKR